jgi:AraC-like DNA-binding protein
MVEIFDNIRKIYQFNQPCEELADYIEFFSQSSAEATQTFAGNTGFSVKMFPSWTPTFWINLGPSYHLKAGDKFFKIAERADLLLIRDCIVERINQPNDHIFTVKFFPGGLESIFEIDQSRMKNQVVNLNKILPLSIIQQVRELNNFDERQQVLQLYFLKQMRRKKCRDHYLHFVRETIAYYENGQLQYNVNELSGRLFTTSKTINRYFNKIIGTSPKEYFNIFRARAALIAWVANKKNFLPTDFGYYDSSHFYREMNRFTGRKLRTPSS